MRSIWFSFYIKFSNIGSMNFFFVRRAIDSLPKEKIIRCSDGASTASLPSLVMLGGNNGLLDGSPRLSDLITSLNIRINVRTAARRFGTDTLIVVVCTYNTLHGSAVLRPPRMKRSTSPVTGSIWSRAKSEAGFDGQLSKGQWLQEKSRKLLVLQFLPAFPNCHCADKII